MDFDAGGIVAAIGELRLRVGEYALFTGSFTADGDTGLGAPDAGVDYGLLSEVAGFSVGGGADVTQLDFGQGVATGHADLAYAGGDAPPRSPSTSRCVPGPHFSGDGLRAAFVVPYGDGSVLSLGAGSATLARLSSDYELLATGVISYNLTHPLAASDVFARQPGVYEAVPGAAFALGGDGGLRERQGGLAGLPVLIDTLQVVLEPLTIDNQGLGTPLAALSIGPCLGGGALYWENVRMEQDGLSLVGETLELPDIVPEEGLFTDPQRGGHGGRGRGGLHPCRFQRRPGAGHGPEPPDRGGLQLRPGCPARE